MKIRQQFPLSVKEAMDLDNRVVTLLGDIGVWSFHKAKEEYPDRVYNIGILEQATISVAAGLAKTGLIPVVHTIAPFLVERAGAMPGYPPSRLSPSPLPFRQEWQPVCPPSTAKPFQLRHGHAR